MLINKALNPGGTRFQTAYYVQNGRGICRAEELCNFSAQRRVSVQHDLHVPVQFSVTQKHGGLERLRIIILQDVNGLMWVITPPKNEN